MGVDISGGMIVGNRLGESVYEICGEDVALWCEEQGMTSMSPWYDSEPEYWTIGYKVKDVSVKEMDADWYNNIKVLGEEFKKITGVEAELKGMVDVY